MAQSDKRTAVVSVCEWVGGGICGVMGEECVCVCWWWWGCTPDRNQTAHKQGELKILDTAQTHFLI